PSRYLNCPCLAATLSEPDAGRQPDLLFLRSDRVLCLLGSRRKPFRAINNRPGGELLLLRALRPFLPGAIARLFDSGLCRRPRANAVRSLRSALRSVVDQHRGKPDTAVF